jgi:myo-inositol-1(or 4)-monophosphatase
LTSHRPSVLLYGMQSTPLGLRARVDFATKLAEEAGELLMGYFGSVESLQMKGEVDLVSEADKASERLLVEGLAGAFPQDAILAEEGGAAGERDGHFQWVIDPLDGTTNFVHGLAHFGVSVGLVVAGVPVAGVIYVPPSRESYVGVVGQGATRNGRAISVNGTAILGDALVATGFPYDRRGRSSELVAVVGRAIERARGVRRCGAACLDLVGVASGVYGGFWEEGLAPWDLAAGVALVRAAGGVVSGFEGVPFELHDGRVIATNGSLHASMVELVGPGAVAPAAGPA